MKKPNYFRTALSLLLTVWLALPMAVFADKKVDTKKAKKNYSEGVKYEVEEKWDLAAQAFLLAVAADPGNAEYRLHAVRAMANASLMYMKRGDSFAAESDFASAYTAYKQAATYDQTNEVALVKMKRMIELQKAAAGMGEAPKINPTTGNYLPAKSDITPPQPQRGRAKDLAAVINYREQPLKQVITNISKQLGLNVIFDETFRDEPKYSLELQNTTLARALDFIFIQKKLTFEQLDRRTILVYFDNPTNRQRFERLLVKTFYINNAKLEEVRQVVQQMLQGGGAGLMRQIAASTQLNALIVRAPAEDLKMIQDVIDSIDKNRAEVSVDVEIYEVTHNTSQQIGNQVALESQQLTTRTGVDSRGNPITSTGASASLSNLGGVLGQGVLAPLVGSAFGIGTGFGALLAAPPTTLSLLQNKTNAKLVSRVNVHAIDGQSNKTNVGRRVPVRLGNTVIPGFSGNTTGTTLPGTGQVGGGLNTGFNNFGYGGFDSIQYQDVGLNIDVTPTVTTEGYIELKMTLESSNTVPGASNLTPEFTQRKLTTISRVLDGRTAVVAGIQQQTKTDGRSTIPIVGLVPILGRLITTPKEASDMSDIIITITPHIIRAPQLEKKDHLAKESGTGLGGNFVSIEHIVSRAQEEDDQDRRIIAAQQGLPQPQATETPTQVSAPLTPPATTPPATNAVVQQVRPEPTPAVAQPADNQVKPQPAANKVEPKTEPEPQENNGVLNETNVEDGGVPPPTYEPPPGYKPELKSPNVTPEQRERFEAARAKALEEAKKNPPPPSDPSKEVGVPAPTYTPPPGYRPQLIPPKKKEKEKGATSAANESKEMSKAMQPQSQPQVLSNEATAPVTTDAQLGLSLKLKDKKMQLGETFIVVVAVDGKSKMAGANIALNYDANLLQLKSVRDGGMLGKNPDITQQDKNGHLFVTLQQIGEQALATTANGKLLILEFKAIGAGQTMIGFNADETRFLLLDKSSPLFSVSPTQFEISRETVSKLTK